MTTLRRLCAVALLLAAVAVPGASPAQAAGPSIGGCPVFPAASPWNQPVDRLPRARGSARMVRAIGAASPLHPDFGSGRWNGGRIGIPYATVSGLQPKLPVRFSDAAYSDPGPYPLPPDAPIEDRPDRHVVIVDRDACRLYELYGAQPQLGGLLWRATAGATWDLRSTSLRPNGWTSADAAGLPIFPGLVRHEEVQAGAIRHALRLAVPRARGAWTYPARHTASTSTDPRLPAMGQRLRLKRRVNPRRFPPQARVVVRALKRYGVLVADEGAPWHLTGAPSEGWAMDQVYALSRLRGRDFEVVDTRSLPRPAP